MPGTPQLSRACRPRAPLRSPGGGGRRTTVARSTPGASLGLKLNGMAAILPCPCGKVKRPAVSVRQRSAVAGDTGQDGPRSTANFGQSSAGAVRCAPRGPIRSPWISALRPASRSRVLVSHGSGAERTWPRIGAGRAVAKRESGAHGLDSSLYASRSRVLFWLRQHLRADLVAQVSEQLLGSHASLWHLDPDPVEQQPHLLGRHAA